MIRQITRAEADRVVDDYTGMTYADYLDNMMVEFEIVEEK